MIRAMLSAPERNPNTRYRIEAVFRGGETAVALRDTLDTATNRAKAYQKNDDKPLCDQTTIIERATGKIIDHWQRRSDAPLLDWKPERALT